MNALLVLAALMQVRMEADVRRDSTDSTKRKVNVEVSMRTGSDDRREPRRMPVTEEHLRTAFKSAPARSMLLRARAARMSQDSALKSYDAMAYMRISAGLG